MKNFPKVSVIVPVYNAEKFLGACLESILNQTLKDFEVLVVDDCSTDSSFSVAESFLEKFGGRLKIISLPKNSGSGAVPRNEGLKFSRGEYIFFMDNDDLLLPTALETLYNFAENYQADVVHMEQGFGCDEETLSQKLTILYFVPPKILRNKILMESDDIAERMKIFFCTGYSVFPWLKFSRRDFLLANEIIFPRVKISEDTLWTIQIICLAKNFLRVPNRLYVWRTVKNSMGRMKRSPEEKIKFWFDPLVNGLDFLDEFMDGIEFFAQNPNYRFELINWFIKAHLVKVPDVFQTLNRCELYDVIYGMFKGKHAALIAYLLVMNNLYRNELRK